MRVPISAMIMICVAGICFFLFIGFNYAIHGDGGLKETIWDSANRTMDGTQLQNFNNLMPQLSQGFGIASVMCFGLAIVLFVVEALGGSRGDAY